ncbi:MAG: hypothetical protein IT443_12350 [Phycisphaeraceae bacterium]|nr:hypothetical protein [Phycisphaeraceae bacterium]
MSHRPPFRFLAIAAATAAAALLLAGCYQEISRSDPWSQLRDLAWADRNQAQTSPSASMDGNWSILLISLDGDNRLKRIQSLMDRLGKNHVPDLWSREESGQACLYRGRYADPSSAKAQDDLRQTRLLELKWNDQDRPFTSAMLVPLGLGAVGSVDSLDLRQFTGSKMYTLQVAFFNSDGGPEFRQAAEVYAQQLRAQGRQAFYYHGKKMSVVTVGLFDESDLIQSQQPGPEGVPLITQSYGPRVRDLQKQFPHNLGNGMTVIEKRSDGSAREQTSFLVPMPDNM